MERPPPPYSEAICYPKSEGREPILSPDFSNQHDSQSSDTTETAFLNDVDSSIPQLPSYESSQHTNIAATNYERSEERESSPPSYNVVAQILAGYSAPQYSGANNYANNMQNESSQGNPVNFNNVMQFGPPSTVNYGHSGGYQHCSNSSIPLPTSAAYHPSQHSVMIRNAQAFNTTPLAYGSEVSRTRAGAATKVIGMMLCLMSLLLFVTFFSLLF
ncbi:hypothetical protein SNE40_003566 [Patella caerulea]|uniref:Uncharacterized protein n=1 Tax=Patella caerulea TaxID=87958 RepID=A0AAN8KIF7_PATCE